MISHLAIKGSVYQTYVIIPLFDRSQTQGRPFRAQISGIGCCYIIVLLRLSTPLRKADLFKVSIILPTLCRHGDEHMPLISDRSRVQGLSVSLSPERGILIRRNSVLHSDEVERKLAMHFAMKCLATLALGTPGQDLSRTQCRRKPHTKSCSSFPRYHDTFCRGALRGRWTQNSAKVTKHISYTQNSFLRTISTIVVP